MANRRLGFWDGKVKFATIHALSTGEKYQSADKMQDILDPWESYVDAQEKTLPTGMKGLKWASNDFTKIATEKAFISGAVYGTVFAIVFAMIVVFFATLNILLTVYATFCISLNILSVMCFMEFFGWAFGIAESLSMVMVIALSVDHIIQLAHQYLESPHKDRR